MPSKEHILMAIALQQIMAQSQAFTSRANEHENAYTLNHIRALRATTLDLMRALRSMQTSAEDADEIARICEPNRGRRD